MQGHQKSAYRLAYELANLELAQILGAMEKLHQQRDRVESALAAIKPTPITVH
jgi:hypothetical protein